MISSMGANELDIDDSEVVVHVNDQSILVSADIKYDPIVSHKACIPKFLTLRLNQRINSVSKV